MGFSVLFEQSSSFVLLGLDITLVLTTKNFIESLDFSELKHTVLIQICSCKDIFNILKLFILQLVRRMNDKFCEIIKLDRLCIGMQMEELVLECLRDRQLLSSDL